MPSKGKASNNPPANDEGGQAGSGSGPENQGPPPPPETPTMLKKSLDQIDLNRRIVNREHRKTK